MDLEDRDSVGAGGGGDRASGTESPTCLPHASAIPSLDPLAAVIGELGASGGADGADGSATPSSVVDFLEDCAAREANTRGHSSGDEAGDGDAIHKACADYLNERGEKEHYKLFSWHNTRRLLSQLGFLNVETWGRLEILDGTKQLVSKIVALDDTPEKDQFICWVLRAINVEVGGKERIKVLDYGDKPLEVRTYESRSDVHR